MKTYPKAEDQHDVMQAQQGDDLAFTRLVEHYQTPVFNLCYRMLGDPDCAEDAAQESFLRAYRNIDRFDPGRSFAAWLLSIAANYCIDQLRRRKLGLVSIDHCAESDDRPMQLADTRAIHLEAALERSEEHRALHHALGKLRATDRAAIILRYWYSLSDAEIAETLEISVSAVKSRLFRARREIAALLDNSGKRPYLTLGLPLVQLI